MPDDRTSRLARIEAALREANELVAAQGTPLPERHKARMAALLDIVERETEVALNPIDADVGERSKA